LATGGPTTRDAVKLWDLEARREILTLPAEGFYFTHLVFSPDGSTLAATSLHGITHLWRAPSWEEIETAEKGKGSP
jgi:WD40 repeat protein